MLLVVFRAPESPSALAEAAGITGLAPAELRQRLTGMPPRVLLGGRGDDLAGIAAKLEPLGFVTAAIDPGVVPTDEDRVVARAFAFGPGDELVVHDGKDEHRFRAADLALIQRGRRTRVAKQTVTTQERRFDATRALLTGGLMVTKKVSKTSVRVQESSEAFLLLERDQGDDVVLYERQLDFRFLGAEVEASSRANFDRLTARLRALAPAARFDDRVAADGFVRTMPLTSSDPVDTAIYLVSLAHRRLRTPFRG